MNLFDLNHPDLTPLLPPAEVARDAGMALVASHNPDWSEMVLAKITALPIGWTGIGEDIRLMIDTKPTHHNAWGAVINMAVRRGLLVDTEATRKMATKKSHARKSPVYERVQEFRKPR